MHATQPDTQTLAPNILSAPHSRWWERLRPYRTAAILSLTLLLFSLALVACLHLLTGLDLDALRTSLLQVPRPALLSAMAATAVGFVALLGYEWSASRFAGVKLPASVLAFAGFNAFAIGNAVGLSVLSGGSVRYRLYARHGVSAAEVTRMSLFASLALGCSLPLLAALATLSDLPDTAAALHLPALWLASVALLVLALNGLLLASIRRRRLPEQPLPNSLLIRVGQRTWRLPGLRLMLLQLPITALDILAAASVLYLLLPEAPAFGVFVLVYLLALAAGVLSHVPGGVGVFEAVLLAAFAEQLGAAPLAAALLLYRLIYVLLPLLLACLLLLLSEARRMLPTAQHMQMASGMAAPVLALLVFLAGMVLVFSGATPAIDSRLQHLGFMLPHGLINASHLGASLIGMLCLLLAQGLRRRLSAAWMLTLLLLLVGAFLSLLKGFDWEEASLLSLTAALLALFRPAFYRPSRLLELPFSARYLLASTCVLVASVWLLLFAYQDVPYEHQLWWQFALDANAPRALRSALACAVLLAGVTLTWLLRPAPAEIKLPQPDELAKAAAIVQGSKQPDGALALSGDKALLFHANANAFLMYAPRGRSLVVLYDPIGPPRERAELIWQFRDLCDLRHARPVFYQVSAENLPLYVDIGLSVLKLGEEARVNLARFELQAKGKAMKDLRYTWNRGQRDGLSVQIYPAGQAPLEELKIISDAWLGGKNVREKGFSLGRFSPQYLQHFRIAVIRHQGLAVGFTNLLETNRQQLASLDLMRVHPQAPKLSMEFLLLGLILYFKEQGYAYFSLGMVPLAGLKLRRGAPLTQRMGSLVFRRSEHFYNFQGLHLFKDKFQPDWEPRYMAVPAGLEPLVALADTATLIAGGFLGLVQR